MSVIQRNIVKFIFAAKFIYNFSTIFPSGAEVIDKQRITRFGSKIASRGVEQGSNIPLSQPSLLVT